MKIILDTDPGIDDAMAFYYGAAHPGIDFTALTTIFGNVTVDDATRNACWLVSTTDADTKIYRGTPQPLEITPNKPSDYVHGPHGFGDVDIGEVTLSAEPEDAVQYLVRAAAENPGVYTLCAIGPLTNVARAVQTDPAFISNLAQLVIMGGSLDAGGNVTPHAEANFWNDPHAAHVVLNAPGGGEIVIAGLDVTGQIAFTSNDFEELAQAAPVTGGFLNQIGQFYLRFYKTVTGKLECHLHDPAALIACQGLEHFTTEQHALVVVTEGEEVGKMMRCPDGSGRKCTVLMGVDAAKVVAQYKHYVSQNT